jgi:CubicO group peptidase (beta-lactamase class C family)
MKTSFSYRRCSAIFLIVAALSFLAVSCSKENPGIVPGESDQNELYAFYFLKSSNPSLTEDCYPYKAGTTFYLTVTEGALVQSLKAVWSAPEGATVKINGVEYESGVSLVNYTNTANVTVTSKSGKPKEYKILVQQGIPALDKLLYAFMYKYSIPGISYAVTLDEEIVYNKGLGFAITEDGTRTTPEHLFRLASISKQFTTLCIMKLVENGKLTLENRVFGSGGVLESEFTNVSALAATVTVKHLLQHTSGWQSNPDPMFTSSFNGQTLDQRISYVLSSPQVTPGTTFSYFNMGFGILGKVIEKITGKGYEVFLKEVLSEAGISDIHIGGDRSGRRSNEVVYYSQSGTNGYGNDMQVIAAAGGVIASTPEMMKLLFHIDGRSKVPDIITSQTRATMLTECDVYNRYALGWRLNHSYFPGSYYHGGNLAGTATMWVMGGSGLNCVILCNSRSYIDSFDDELYGLIRDVISFASYATW